MSSNAIIARADHHLSDSEGILAFALRRRGLEDLAIARALGTDASRVGQFFSQYRAHWPRALAVPKDWTPSDIERETNSRVKKFAGRQW